MSESSDPWSSGSKQAELPCVKAFEDDFANKLPDSAEYVATLENKLKKLKRGSGKTEKEILNSLEEKKRDVLVNLLAEDFSLSSEDVVEENIPTKWLKSHINPQQALTVGELAELVKADYLAKASEQADEQEDTS